MKKIKFPSNLVSGIASIIAGIVLWFVIPQQVGLEKTISYGITSRSVPTAIAVLFVVGGVILVLQSLVFKKEKSVKRNFWLYVYETNSPGYNF